MIKRQCTAAGVSAGATHPTAKFSDEQITRMKELHAQGYGFSTIARVVGCSNVYAAEVIRGKWRKAPLVGVRKSLTAADLPAVQAALAEGLGAKEIVEKWGVTASSVNTLIRQANGLDGKRKLHPATKLTPADITAMRIMREEDGMSYRTIARAFGVSLTLAIRKCAKPKAVNDGATH